MASNSLAPPTLVVDTRTRPRSDTNETRVVTPGSYISNISTVSDPFLTPAPSNNPFLTPAQSDCGSSVLTVDPDVALQADPGTEADFHRENNPFAFSPGQLNKLQNPKSLPAFRALGGLSGITRGLQSDINAGLSIDETAIRTSVTFEQAVRRTSDKFLESPERTSKSDSDPFGDRTRVFGKNILPAKKATPIWVLMWNAYNDKVIILLTVAAVISLALGLYETFGTETKPGDPPSVDWVEGVAIIIAILIVTLVGSLNDWQKERAFVKLNAKKEDREIKVVRSGKSFMINVHEILVGDVLHLEPGDLIPVDGVFIAGHDLKCDESSATGESDAIKKTPGEQVMKLLESGASQKGLDPFIISGSKVLEGVGTFLCTSVGVNSSFGKILMSVRTEIEATPLQKKLEGLAVAIAKLGASAAGLLFFILLFRFVAGLSTDTRTSSEKASSFLDILIVAVTIVVVAVPEGLPLAVTLALAFATTRLLKENNLVRVLRACETMGNATAICSDKTGTLTTNRMTVVRGTFGGSNFTKSESEKPDAQTIVQWASSLSQRTKDAIVQSVAINSTAFEGEEAGQFTFIGSKTETALLELARDHLGMQSLSEARANEQVMQMMPFDSGKKCMGAVIKLRDGSGYRLLVKGASEILLSYCSEKADIESFATSTLTDGDRNGLTSVIDSYAKGSLRTIGIVYKDFPQWPPATAEVEDGHVKFESVLKDLVWLGVVGIQDPVRPGVPEAVLKAQKAGVVVRMVTGDNAITAQAIATECGIYTDGLIMEGPEFRRLREEEMDAMLPRLQVLARSSPEDKRILVARLKALGETVAVTGDGTNDAPALKTADVGFSMGICGTEVAKEASEIVLMDDNFTSILTALKWGRAVNDSVQKFLQFQITVNITAVLLAFISAVASPEMHSVLTAVQLLWVNLIMDTFAALALATDPPTERVLDRLPQPKSAPIITTNMWKMIIGQAIFQLVVTLVLYFAGNSILGYDPYNDTQQTELKTMVFNTFVWMQIFNEFNNRRLDNKFNILEGVHRNKFFILINCIMIGAQIAIVFVGGAAFEITKIDGTQWAICVVAAAVCLPWAILVRLFPDVWFAKIAATVGGPVVVVYKFLANVFSKLGAIISRIWRRKKTTPSPEEEKQEEENKESREKDVAPEIVVSEGDNGVFANNTPEIQIEDLEKGPRDNKQDLHPPGNQLDQTEGDASESSSGKNPINSASQKPDDPRKHLHPRNETVTDYVGERPLGKILWAEAYKKFKANPENSKLLAKYKDYLKRDGGELVDSNERSLDIDELAESTELEQIQTVAKKRLEELPEARLKFSVGGKSFVARDIVLKAVQVVLKFKDIVGAAISAEPCAALAFAGVLVILPLLEDAFQQDEDAANGLHNILFLLVRYQSLQETVLEHELTDPSQSSNASQLSLNIREKVVDVYTRVYEYQIRFVIHYRQNKALRKGRNALSADDWKTKWTEIESISRLIDAGIHDLMDGKTREIWTSVNDIKTSVVRIEDLHLAMMTLMQGINQEQYLLKLPFAGHAPFDSGVVQSSTSPCLEGTQRSILNEIQRWAESPIGEVIFWLRGMAGTGKTSIALTVANALSKMKQFADAGQPPRSTFLGASFFFKQGDTTRDNTKKFWPTIATILAESYPDLKPYIAAAIKENSAIGTKAQVEQFTRLIMKPISVLDEQTFLPIRLVVVIDALDECLERSEAEELLGMLTALDYLRQIQFRVLITSRDDDHISRRFNKIPRTLYHVSTLEKIKPSYASEGQKDDIILYVTHTLDQIAQNYDVQHGCISPADIDRLSKKADGLFIYAATACRFLDTEDFRSSFTRKILLDIIFDDERETNAPQQKVDEIYVKVLSFPDVAKKPRRIGDMIYTLAGNILGSIAVFFEPIPVSSLGHLQPGRSKKEDVEDILRRVRSVVYVPQDEESCLGLVHLSFRDFLLSEERSKDLPFQVRELSMHRQVLERCCELMSQYLHQDMCKLKRPGSLASEVPTSQLKENIPHYLRYACRYWVDHLARLDEGQREEFGLKDDGKVHTFLLDNLLYWLETMSLIREMPAAVLIVNRLHGLVNPGKHATLSALLHDAKRFVLSNRWVIDHAPLQIYSSALVFSPMTSVMRSKFEHLIPSWITQRPIVQKEWTPELFVLENPDDNYIDSFAFSPVDDIIAYGSVDRTTRIWDYVTGTERFKFDDSTTVHCLAFSPDGKMIASGLGDGVIRVREFATGRVIDLVSHSEDVYDVAFSPKTNNTVASKSSDGTVRIWNVDEGVIKNRVIHDDASDYGAIAFSPDGNILAIASRGEVQLRNVEKRTLIKTFKCKINELCVMIANAITIAEDGEIAVPSSCDRIVDLCESWGHDRIVAYSPLKKQIILGSWRGDFELRHVDNWELLYKVHFDWAGRTARIRCSRNGDLLAIKSRASIHILDTTSMIGEFEHEVHKKDHVHSIRFLAGDGNDNLVCTVSNSRALIWDAAGEQVKLGSGSGSGSGSGPVRSVTSQERSLVVSLVDRTVPFGNEISIEDKTGKIDNWKGVSFSSDKNRMALYSDRIIFVLDTITLEKIATFDYNESSCNVFFSPDNEVLVGVCGETFNGTIYLWNIATMKELVIPSRVCNPSIFFSFNSELLAFQPKRSDDILLLEVATGKERCTLSGTGPYPPIVAFHPTEYHLVAAKADRNQICVWDTTSGRERNVLQITDSPDLGSIKSMAISTTGKLVVAFSRSLKSSSSILLWDIAECAQIGCVRLDFWRLDDLSFLSNSHYVASNRGRIPLLPPFFSQETTSTDISETMQNCLYVGSQWVVQGFEDLLWLPPTYRPKEVTSYHEMLLAVKDETIVLGHDSGLVTVVKFDLANTPMSW
ncbi:hypothetical protein F4804DRAFT_352610 [Jackrogersella minutella]|nr:hypothetical protein F4804DRAFT_352610 [Jackrogersella minutella]